MLRKLSICAAVSMATLFTGCASTMPDLTSSNASHQASDASLKRIQTSGIIVNSLTAPAEGDMSSEIQTDFINSLTAQATRDGIKVITAAGTDAVPVTIHVDEYHARSTAARLLIGALAGKDHIKATVTVGQSSFVVEDTARTAINGINTVAENVGVQAGNGIASLAGVKVQ
jgi:hypothetical protein